MRFSWFQAMIILVTFLIIAIPSVVISPDINSDASLDITQVSEYLKQPPSELGLSFDRYGNTLVLSKNSRYLAIEGFSGTDRKMKTKFAVIDLINQTVVHKGVGNIDRASTNRYLIITDTDADKTTIFDLRAIEGIYTYEGIVYDMSVSPDERLLALVGSRGSELVRLKNNEVLYQSKKRHAFEAWFSDSKRIASFLATGTSLGDGAYWYKPSIFDSTKKQWNNFPPPDNRKTFKDAEWLVQDKLLWVTAGFDTGAYQYIYDFEKNDYTYIRETSGVHPGLTQIRTKRAFLELANDSYSLISYTGDQLVERNLKTIARRDMATPIEKGKRVIYRASKNKSPLSDIRILSVDKNSDKLLKEVTHIMGPLVVDKKNSFFVIPTKNSIEVGRIPDTSVVER